MSAISKYRGVTFAVEMFTIVAASLLLALATSSFLPILIGLPITLVVLLKSLVRVEFGTARVLEQPGGMGIGLLPRGLYFVPWPLLRGGPTLGMMPESFELTLEAPTAQPGVPVQVELAVMCGQMLPGYGTANCHQVFSACMVKAYARELWMTRRNLALKTAVCQAVRRYFPEDVLGQSEAFSAQLTRLVEDALAQQGVKLLGELLVIPSLAPSAHHLQNVYVQATGKAVNDRLMRQRTVELGRTISALGEHLTPQQAMLFYTMQHHTSGEGGESDYVQLLMLQELMRGGVMAERLPTKPVIDLHPLRDEATRPNTVQGKTFRRWADDFGRDDDQQAA